MKSTSWIFLVLVLAGCMPSAGELSAGDDATCRSYGLGLGAPGYAECRQNIALNRQAAGAAMLYRPVAPPQPVPFYPMQTRSTGNTTCFNAGSQVHCQSR